MKKTISIMLALGMTLSIISGCASKSEPADSSAEASVEQESDEVSTVEEIDSEADEASESSQDKQWTVVSDKNFSFEAPADSTVKQLDTVTLIMPDEYDDNTYYSIRELPLGDLTDDDYFTQMSEMTSDALADQLVMEPEEFTKEIGGRTIRGMIYSFRNDDGKTITAIQYLEPVGDSWYQYFCDYISESEDEDALPDETTVAEFEHAIETLTFEEN